jgi:chaperonin GroEL (HSP60 family)
MKIEIDIEIPKGFHFVRYDYVRQGEHYLSDVNVNAVKWLCSYNSTDKHIILQKDVKQGKDLIGCLCGTAYHSLKTAKDRVMNKEGLIVIKDYNEKLDLYEATDGYIWNFAYPVSKEDIQELLNKIGE